MICKVVFDTNVLFSAIGWRGRPYQCIQKARMFECLSICCEEILEELQEKLILKRGLSPDQASEIAEEIQSFSKMVSIPGMLRAVPLDPDDDKILECALVGGASHVVSGDHHLLDLKKHQGIRMVRAAEFLDLIAST